MQEVIIGTFSGQITSAYSTNVTGTALTSLVLTTTEPSGQGIISWGAGGPLATGAFAKNAIKLYPYGVGSDSQTFNMNLWGWERVVATNQKTCLWKPVLLATFTSCTLDSALPGIAGSDLGTTQYECSAITLGIGNSGISVEVVSPGHAAHQQAHAVADGKGMSYLQIDLAVVNCTSANCLYGRI